MHGNGVPTPEGNLSPSRKYVCEAPQLGIKCTARCYIEPIEVDYFTYVLYQDPLTLIEAARERRSAMRAQLLVTLEDVWNKLLFYIDQAAGLPESKRDEYKKTRVDPLRQKHAELELQIKELTCEPTKASKLTPVYKAIREAFHIPNDINITDAKALGANLHDQLYNQDIRRKLIAPLKLIVILMEVDGERQRYRVHTVDGVGEWRDISVLVTALRKDLASHCVSEEVKSLQSKCRTEYWATISPEEKAALLAKRKATLAAKSDEEKETTRRLQSEAAKAAHASLTSDEHRKCLQKQIGSDIERCSKEEQLKAWAQGMAAKRKEARDADPAKQAAAQARMAAMRKTKAAKWAAMSEEERAAINAKIGLSIKASRAAASPEENAARGAKISAALRAREQNANPAERAAALENLAAARKVRAEKLATMSSEEREAISAKMSVAMTGIHAHRSAEDKAAIKAKNSAAMKAWMAEHQSKAHESV